MSTHTHAFKNGNKLRRSELAKLLAVTPGQVGRLVRAKIVPPGSVVPSKDGGQVRFRWGRELQRFVAERRDWKLLRRQRTPMPRPRLEAEEPDVDPDIIGYADVLDLRRRSNRVLRLFRGKTPIPPDRAKLILKDLAATAQLIDALREIASRPR